MLGIGPRSIVSRPPLWLLLSGSAAAQEVVLNGAQTLLDGETDGLAFDFTDSSAYIIDTGTPANNYNSTGIVSNGSLVGPSGKLTYTSPSNKLTMQADGYIKYQAHNLYLNSEAPANQSITVVSGASYAVTITGTVSVTASGAATGTWTAGTNTFTAATTTLTLGSTSGSGTVHVRRTPSNDDYIETAGAAKYALPLEYDTSGNCLGLLVEEARTNLQTYSNAFSNAAWTKTLVSVAQNATGVDGLTSAWTMTDSSSTTNFRVSQNPTLTAAAYSHSIYAKAGTVNWLRITLDNTSTGTLNVWYNLSTGAVGTTSPGITATIASVGNGWYRCTATATMTAAACRVYFGMHTADNQATYAGDGTGTLLIQHAQTELGSFPTSPIVTYGSASSRLADNISIATSAFPHSTTATTMYLKAIPFVDDGGDVLLEKAAPNRADAMTQIYPSGSGLLSINERGAASATQATASEAITYDGVTSVKAAVSAQTNLFDFSINGSTETQDTSGTHQATAHTTVNIGTGTQSQGAGRVIVQEVLLLPRISTAAELIARTS